MDVDNEIDTSGLNCPMPILRMRQALNNMEAGQKLRVISTDPGSQKDFPAFANQTGHLLLDSQTDNGKYIYVVEKRAD